MESKSQFYTYTSIGVKYIDEEMVSDGVNKFVSFGLIGLLFIATLRLFRRREPEMKIGLPQSITDREINLYKNSQMYNSSPIANKSIPAMNYGLNAYQKENKNPYESVTTQIHNPKLREYANSYTQPVAPQPQAMPQVNYAQQVRPQTVTMPQSQVQVKKMTTPVNTAPVNQSNPNIDNLKFLESMTAIYEKSGRHDLARGLKASLNKNNLK